MGRAREGGTWDSAYNMARVVQPESERRVGRPTLSTHPAVVSRPPSSAKIHFRSRPVDTGRMR